MSSFSQSAGIGAASDQPGTTGTSADTDVRIGRAATRAAGNILAGLAADLASIAAALTHAIAHDDSAVAWAALRALECSGATADRAAQALGVMGIKDPDDWTLSPMMRDALATLEAGATPAKGGDA